MKYAFAHWQEFEGKLSGRHVMLFLDYDGTLTPIVDDPKRALLPDASKEILLDLMRHKRYTIAVISGRSLEDIKKLVGIKGIIYAGNHGFEIEGPRIKFRSPVYSAFRKVVRELKPRLLEKISVFKGAFLEDKGFSLTLHYRQVEHSLVPKIKTAFEEAMFMYTVGNKIYTKPGKMVMEIRPPVSWDKGKTVLWLFARQKFANKAVPLLPLYIGDDITDEDAFRALRNKGIGVYVGTPKESGARFYVRNAKEVLRLLQELLRLKEGDAQCRN